MSTWSVTNLDKQSTISNLDKRWLLEIIQNCDIEDAIQIFDIIIEKMKYNQNDVYWTDNYLEIIIRNNNPEIVKVVLDHMTDDQLVQQNIHGTTPLHFSTKLGNPEIITLFLERLSDEHLLVINRKGNTILHMLCRQTRDLDNRCYNVDLIKNILARIPPEGRFIQNNNGNVPVDLTEVEIIKNLFQPTAKGSME